MAQDVLCYNSISGSGDSAVCGGGLPQFAASDSVCCLNFGGAGYMIPSLDITTCFSCMDFVGELCRCSYNIMHSLKYHASTDIYMPNNTMIIIRPKPLSAVVLLVPQKINMHA